VGGNCGAAASTNSSGVIVDGNALAASGGCVASSLAAITQLTSSRGLELLGLATQLAQSYNATLVRAAAWGGLKERKN
jgi:hypothetical protein